MRIASSTISEASMKTWLAASAAPSPTTAMPPQAHAVRQLEPDERAPPVADVDLCRAAAARNLRQAAIMKNLMEMTIASHAEACSTGAQNIEASEKMTREQRQRDARGELVAREHGQQLVFELRLDAGALRKPRAHLAHLRLRVRARVLGARRPWVRLRLRVFGPLVWSRSRRSDMAVWAVCREGAVGSGGRLISVGKILNSGLTAVEL